MINTIKILLAIILLLACAISVVEFDPWLNFNASSEHLWLNILPVIFLALIIYGLFRRSLVSVISLLSILVIIFSVNHEKLKILHEPLVFGDLMLIQQVTIGWALMKEYSASWVFIPALLVLVALVLFCKYEKPAMKWYFGGVPIIVGLVGFYTLVVIGGETLGAKYSVWNNNSAPWQFGKVAKNQGLIASLIVGGQMYGMRKPAFNDAVIGDFMQSRQASHVMPVQENKPDIVLWLSESFFDPSIMADVDSCELWPRWCVLQGLGLTANLSVNTFGGGTVRTEFEVLTGVPMGVMQGHDFPYVSYVHSPTASIAWQLKKEGYATLATHPHAKNFWRRARALPLLGFDHFEGEEAFIDAPRSGYYISDETLTDRVITHLEEAQQPSFIMAISMENHGPWGARENIDDAYVKTIPSPAILDNDLKRAWQEYLYHGERAVTQLDRLYSYILTREKPTLVIFFGDHLPGIAPVFDALTFKDEQLGAYSPVPALALANYPLMSEWAPQNAYGLGTWALQLAGQLGGSNFYEMNVALKSRNNNEDDALQANEALIAMQIRQLYLVPTNQ
jgi:phosphoglycerol transferase MdoB-like AlkP superfamily enzyme